MTRRSRQWLVVIACALVALLLAALWAYLTGAEPLRFTPPYLP